MAEYIITIQELRKNQGGWIQIGQVQTASNSVLQSLAESLIENQRLIISKPEAK